MKELTELELADLWKEVKEDFWGDISLQTQKMVKKLMETTLEEEMRAYIGISRYGRSEDRKGYRNGFYPRGLLTSFGYISEIPVCRQAGKCHAVVRKDLRPVFLSNINADNRKWINKLKRHFF